MTNLPISSQTPQPANSAAGALPANIAADSLATEAQPAGFFAFLLAQQIGETDLLALNAAQTALASESNAADISAELLLKEAQDHAAAASVPADAVAALLQQLPTPEDKQAMPLSPFAPFQNAEDKQAMPLSPFAPFQNAEGKQAMPSSPPAPLQKAEDKQAMPLSPLAPFQKAEDNQAMPSSPFAPFQKAEGNQAMPPFARDHSQSAGRKELITDQTIQIPAIVHFQAKAAERAEMLSGLALPAQNTAQQTVFTGVSTAMPGALTNHISAGAPPAIAAPLGSSGWAEEFSQKISWISTQRNQVAELHLNPPNLGPLEVVLKISDNHATALFTSPHGAVRDAVENAMPKLREILADNGIMLGNTTVSDQSPRDRSSDGFMNRGSGTAAQPEVSSTMSEQAGVLQAAAPAHRHNGMVDTFA